jgi:hypothetical protein
MPLMALRERVAARGVARLRQCSGMSPEAVRLDRAGADEFLVVCQSLPRNGSVRKGLACSR